MRERLPRVGVLSNPGSLRVVAGFQVSISGWISGVHRGLEGIRAIVRCGRLTSTTQWGDVLDMPREF